MDRKEIEQLVRTLDADPNFLWQTAQFGGRFYCPTDICVGRAKHALAKERDTIAWLDQIPQGACLWDIGANVGVYTIYAGLVRGAQVAAFEPGAANYSILNKNIHGNGLGDKVAAYCICVGESKKVDRLFMQDLAAGGALHNFGSGVDYKGDDFTPSFLQGSLSVSADLLVHEFGLTPPDYMKVDVDGLEKSIMKGAVQLLSRPEFKSLLIEANLDDEQEVMLISDIAASAGLTRETAAPHNAMRLVENVRIQNLIFSRSA